MNRTSTYRTFGVLTLAATTIVGAPAASADSQDGAQASAPTATSSSKGGVDAIGLTGLGAAIASGVGLVYLQRERRNERSSTTRRR